MANSRFFFVFCLLAAAGCSHSSRPDWLNSMLGDERSQQVISGPKRPPVLNPAAMPPAHPPRPPMPPAGREMTPPPPPPDFYHYDAPPEMPPPHKSSLPPAESEENASWFSRLMAKLKGNAAPESQGEYPELSSVPELPEVFSDVKSQTQANMESLQQERIWAEQQRQALAAEPPLPEAAPASSPSEPPVLLGHVSSQAPLPKETAAAAQAKAEAPGLPAPSTLQAVKAFSPAGYADRLRALQQPAAAR